MNFSRKYEPDASGIGNSSSNAAIVAKPANPTPQICKFSDAYRDNNLATLATLAASETEIENLIAIVGEPEFWPFDLRVQFEERCAHLEFDYGLSREEAELRAGDEFGLNFV